MSSQTVNNNICLFLASDEFVVRRLLFLGANPNGFSWSGHTPLTSCVNNPRKLQALLEHGADPNMKDALGVLPFDVTQDGDFESQHILMIYGAAPQSYEDSTKRLDRGMEMLSHQN